jgi:4-amino-4-deoxy-L-arabinose transferase-like glycosyltransferase
MLTNAQTSLYPAVALQCLMGILLVIVAWPVMYRLGGSRGAVLGTVFLCFDPLVVLHQNLILTEALYLLIFTKALVAALLYLDDPSLYRAAVAGVGLGLAALIKPTALVVGGLFILISFKDWKKALWLAVFTFSIPGLWVVRNWNHTGFPVYTVQGNFTLLQYTAAGAMALDTGRQREDVLKELEAPLISEASTTGVVPLSLAYKRKAVAVIRQHSVATLHYMAMGAVRVLGGTGLEMVVDLFKSQSVREKESLASPELQISGSGTWALLKAYPLLIPLQGMYMVFLLGGYALFVKGLRDLFQSGQWRLAALAAASVILILVISTIPGGYYRLRLPMMPFLALGIAAATRKKSQFFIRSNERQLH